MSDNSFPVCACADFWSGHHPECPVLRHMEKDRAEIERLRDALERVVDAGMTTDHFAIRIAEEARKG